MINSFDLLNRIFDLLANDEDMSYLLNIDLSKTGNDLLDIQNNKLKREYQPAEYIKPSDAPFIAFYFMHSDKTKNNWLVNVGDLFIDIYTNNFYQASLITKRLRKLIADNLKILMVYEGQHYSGVTGVFKYRLIYNPLIDGK